MRVIPPIDVINSDILIYSSIEVGEGDPVAWNPTYSYSVGDRVHLVSKKTVYEALTAGVGIISPELDSTKWVKVRTMNRWAMFDWNSSDVKSEALDEISILVKPGTRINSVAILDFENVSQIYIKAIDAFSGVVYENVYVPPIKSNNYIDFNIPINAGNSIEVVISGVGLLKVERLVFGFYEFIGDIQRNSKVDSLNFSNVERDDFGYTSIVRRRSVATVEHSIFILADRVSKVVALRDKLNSAPAVWCSLQNDIVPDYYSSFILFGIYRQFSVILNSSIHATISLEIEEI